MKLVKRLFIAFAAVVGLLSVISVCVLFVPHLTQGQGGNADGPTRPVRVVNTPAEPVPVTAGGQPFQENLAGARDEFTVPADKRLVIEYVSGVAANTTACRLVSVIIETTVQGRTIGHRFIPTLTATSSAGALVYVVSQETSLYADPGTSVLLNFSYTVENPCDPSVFVAISGNLVDVP